MIQHITTYTTSNQKEDDPQPRFVGNERCVVVTTTVRGQVDLAIVATAELVKETQPQDRAPH